MLLIGPAASALATTSVRFVHAVPGAPAGQLSAGETQIDGPVGFGEQAGPVEIEAGDVQFRLTAEGDDELANTMQELEDGESYTVIALAEGEGAQLRAYRDGRARAGRALVRMIHASPELGDPNVQVGDRMIAEGLAYREATDYASVRPGNYDLAFVPPDGGDPLAEENVTLSAGTATTGIVAGSRGEETTVIVLEDDTVAPRSAPDTGLGGMASEEGGSRMLLIILIALGAGVLGAGSYGVATAGGRRGRAG